MSWISNHKHKIEEKWTKSSWSSSKVVGLGPAGRASKNLFQPPYTTVCFVKGIKNGCPCIVEMRGTQGCAMVGDPARAVGEFRDVAKAQP